MGLAIKIEEYVPIPIPTIMAKAKLWIISPPRKNNANKTKRVVEDVRIVLLSVSLMLRFISSGKGIFLLFFIFSLILSNTMIVSFKE